MREIYLYNNTERASLHIKKLKITEVKVDRLDKAYIPGLSWLDGFSPVRL